MNSPVIRKRVGVLGDVPATSLQPLFRALALLYPVEFCDAETAGKADFDALILLNGDLEAGLQAAVRGTSTYVQIKAGKRANLADHRIIFGSSRLLDSVLRNQTMTVSSETDLRTLSPAVGDEIFATCSGAPIWLARMSGKGLCHLVGTSLPEMGETALLFQHLNGGQFMGLLPLIHFLRSVVKDLHWDEPPSRACFIFDDPSMYRKSYGFLDYQRLAEHATKHGYYVSIATIPLDTWWVNDGVAATLRHFSPRLSVLIHGNNHTTDEMLIQDREAGYLAVAAQAMRRMERLTQNHRIPFLKVMEAPHGALADGLLPQLLVLGYEAALCTPALFVRHNKPASWPASFGLDRSEMLGGGLPILPRIRMSPRWKNDVLLAAFLRQPIIIAGHHGDAAHDMELLEELAEVIKGIDGVSWSDLEGILRTNYRQRVERNVLTVKMYSRRVVVTIPPGVTQLNVHRSWIGEGSSEKLTVAANSVTHIVQGKGAIADGIALPEAITVEISSEIENPRHYTSVNSPNTSIWPIARKTIMEVRDRLSPMLPIVDRLRRRPDSSSK